MKKESKGYQWTYYPQIKSGYVKVSDQEIKRQLPLVEGKVILDLDEKDSVVGIEIFL